MDGADGAVVLAAGGLADAVSVIDRGRVIAEGSPERLKSRLGGDQLRIVVEDPGALGAAAAIAGRLSGAEPEVDAAALTVGAPVPDRVAALTGAVRALDEAGVRVADIGVRRPTLDEVFLHLTGGTATGTDRPAHDQEVPA
ncbi:hypothetical protein F8568_011360 [Actinomadura sp. LD22]|uniref:DUF4162 domain-containing protein n=1 Tax=Actinomadura physcomitrii TaxID=2650748 RepID=A0A6I4M7K4_9ACTN|nr:hypothetical protein [Actinomadura physcomitrii]MWA00970.1 hypothetical protein [Actinomadura physcomitrii]